MQNKSYFLHIPKTAGSTLREVFRKNFGEDFLLVPGNNPFEGMQKAQKYELWDEKKMIWLHGDFDSCINASSVFTMLREPLARMESFYFYVKSQPNHYLYNLSHTVSCIEFFEKAESLEINNGQARIIAGFGGYHKMHASNQHTITDTDLLVKAQNNLFNEIHTFGLQNYFFESLVLFENALKWKKGIAYNSLNKRTDAFASSRFSQKELDCIKAVNAVDIELFEEANAIFLERMSKLKIAIRKLKFKVLGV